MYLSELIPRICHPPIAIDKWRTILFFLLILMHISLLYVFPEEKLALLFAQDTYKNSSTISVRLPRPVTLRGLMRNMYEIIHFCTAVVDDSEERSSQKIFQL